MLKAEGTLLTWGNVVAVAAGGGGGCCSSSKGCGGRTVTVVALLEYAGHGLGITHSRKQKKEAGHDNWTQRGDKLLWKRKCDRSQQNDRKTNKVCEMKENDGDKSVWM
jgi:hypothetical protein